MRSVEEAEDGGLRVELRRLRTCAPSARTLTAPTFTSNAIAGLVVPWIAF